MKEYIKRYRDMDLGECGVIIYTSNPEPPKRYAWTVHCKGFGLAYWHDVYDKTWHPVARETYNLVFLIFRFQLIIY